MNVRRNVLTLWTAKMVAAGGQFTWNWCVLDQVLSKFEGFSVMLNSNLFVEPVVINFSQNNQSRSTRCVLEP